MAKRVPPDEKPYRPVDEALVRSVLRGSPLEETTLPPTTSKAMSPVESSDVAAPVIAESPLTSALALPKGQEPKSQPEVTATGVEKLSREKRVLLTKSEEREIERFVDRLADELETPLKLSHLLRACMVVVRHAESEILAQAREAEELERPPNGDPVALARFERQLAQILSAALRQAAPLE